MYYFFLYLFSLAWLAAIWWSASLFLRRIGGGLSKGTAVTPAFYLFVLTGPLWIEAVSLEFQCRSSGLEFREVRDASREGLFWRSHEPEPSGYSAGIRLGTDGVSQQFTFSALRALAEGRLGYLEVPLSSRTVFQRLYVAKRDTSGVECLGGEQDLGGGYGRLPNDLCFAWEKSKGQSARYEFVGLMTANQSGQVMKIKDRIGDMEVARYSYVRSIRASSTLLGFLGIPSLQPYSCTVAMADALPAAHLLDLVFTSRDMKSVSRTELSDGSKAKWNVDRTKLRLETRPWRSEG
jgi:hypothetical protein